MTDPAETDRLQDLVDELRRRLETRDRIARQARERIASALGMEPVPRSWDILATEVERRLGEDAVKGSQTDA